MTLPATMRLETFSYLPGLTDEQVARQVVELLGTPYLLQNTILHHRDLGGHGHRLNLVVGDVDERGPQPLVQLRDLGAGLDPELGVEVGEGFVQEENRRLADDSPTQGDALALAARKLPWLALEQLLDAEDLGGFVYALADLRLGRPAQRQAEGHVVVDGHVWVESVGLEDHGDVAVLGGDVVDQAVADVDVAFRDFLQACQQPEGSGLAAAGGPNKDKELPIRDLEIKVADGDNGVEALGHVLVGDGGHRWRSPTAILARRRVS